MSVYKPSKGRYWHYDFVLKGRRYYGSTGAETRSKAERVERRKREQAALGELDRPERAIPTLDEAAGAWWLDKQQDNKTAGAVQEEATRLVALVGPALAVNAVTATHVQTAIAKRRGLLTRHGKVPAPATINRWIIAILRPILKHARRRLNDGSGPPIAFPEIDWKDLSLPTPKPRAVELTADEVPRLLASIPAHYHEMVGFQRRYGLRAGEMFFRPEAVDVEGRRLFVRERKGRDDHTVPVLDEDAAMLAARVSRSRKAGLQTVWYRDERGALRALTYGGYLSALKRAFIRTGLKAARGLAGSHVLRHDAGMKFLRGSKDLRATQRLLGHASIASTMVYAHADEDAVRAGLAQLSRPAPEPPATAPSEESAVPKRGNGS